MLRGVIDSLLGEEVEAKAEADGWVATLYEVGALVKSSSRTPQLD